MKNNVIQSKDVIADMHTHTISSLHAYSTIRENIEVGKQNLKYIANTDHIYLNGDKINLKNEFMRIAYLEETINPYEFDINVISGAEFNLGQTIPQGKDYFDKIKDIVWKPIGLHSWTIDIPSITLEELYQEFKDSSNFHNCFAHIERELHKVDDGQYKANKYGGNALPQDIKLWLEAICILAKEKDIYLEVNEASLYRNEDNTRKRLEYWLKFAKRNGNKICLGSDAHYCKCVGNFEQSLKILNEIEYPKELILNCNEDMILDLYKR